MAIIDQAAVELFKSKAVPVTIQVTEVEGMKEAMAYAIAVCKKKEPCQLLLAGEAGEGEASPERAGKKTLAAPNLDDGLYAELEALGGQEGFIMLRSGARGYLAGLDVAFTTADKAIAETATCVLKSFHEDVRLATMLCETHVIALKKSQIVNTFHDAEEYLHELMTGEGAAYTAFISGPSRTADIERVLALGVHGPLELHIALMED
jgi:L-lactate dehydrogenase complex protein LldG